MTHKDIQKMRQAAHAEIDTRYDEILKSLKESCKHEVLGKVQTSTYGFLYQRCLECGRKIDTPMPQAPAKKIKSANPFIADFDIYYDV